MSIAQGDSRNRSDWFLVEALNFRDCRTVTALWIGIAVAVVTFGIVYSEFAPWMIVGAVALGLIAWSPVEYFLHRHAMHWEPADPKLRAFVERVMPHAGHHRMPNGRLGTVWRQQQYPFAMVFVCFLAACLTTPVALAAAFFAGIGLGYMFYELVHHAIHKCRMHGPIGMLLKRHHMLHHIQDAKVNFGLTSRFWDRVFGTLGVKAPPRAERMRQAGPTD